MITFLLFLMFIPAFIVPFKPAAGGGSGSVTVYPDGDISIGSWIDQAAGTSNIYTSIDEGTGSPNDSDYIYTGTNATTYRCSLQNMPSDFVAITSVTLKARALKVSSKNTKLITFSIVDSTGAALTTGSTPTLTTSFTTFSMTLTVTGSTSKSAWDGAQIKMLTDSNSGNVQVSAVQVEITYTK